MNNKRYLWTGLGLLAVFAVWTALICRLDVEAVGPLGTQVGFAVLNRWFHRFTGVHMTLYTVTDWLGLVPIGVCVGFGAVGFVQLLRRRRLGAVDGDILLTGAYYLVIVLGYLVFEAVPINYRPVLIDGRLEASYPSSTTLLVLGVMPTLPLLVGRRCRSAAVRAAAAGFAAAFSVFVVAGRLASGVHWFTDIVGAVLLGFGLYYLYRYGVAALDGRREMRYGVQ